MIEVESGKTNSNRGWIGEVGGSDDVGLSSHKCSGKKNQKITAQQGMMCMAHMPPSL